MDTLTRRTSSLIRDDQLPSALQKMPEWQQQQAMTEEVKQALSSVHNQLTSMETQWKDIHPTIKQYRLRMDNKAAFSPGEDIVEQAINSAMEETKSTLRQHSEDLEATRKEMSSLKQLIQDNNRKNVEVQMGMLSKLETHVGGVLSNQQRKLTDRMGEIELLCKNMTLKLEKQQAHENKPQQHENKALNVVRQERPVIVKPISVPQPLEPIAEQKATPQPPAAQQAVPQGPLAPLAPPVPQAPQAPLEKPAEVLLPPSVNASVPIPITTPDVVVAPLPLPIESQLEKPSMFTPLKPVLEEPTVNVIPLTVESLPKDIMSGIRIQPVLPTNNTPVKEQTKEEDEEEEEETTQEEEQPRPRSPLDLLDDQ